MGIFSRAITSDHHSHSIPSTLCRCLQNPPRHRLFPYWQENEQYHTAAGRHGAVRNTLEQDHPLQPPQVLIIHPVMPIMRHRSIHKRSIPSPPSRGLCCRCLLLSCSGVLRLLFDPLPRQGLSFRQGQQDETHSLCAYQHQGRAHRPERKCTEHVPSAMCAEMRMKCSQQHHQETSNEVQNPDHVAHANGLVCSGLDSQADKVSMRTILHHFIDVICHWFQVPRIRRIL